MAWIQTTLPPDATGLLKEEYERAVERAGRIYHIVRLQSLNPGVLRDAIRFYVTLMHGPSELSRAQREMLATVVSAVNRCRY